MEFYIPGRTVHISVEPSQLVLDSVCSEVNKIQSSSLIVSWLSLLADSPLLLEGQKPNRTFHEFYVTLISNPLKDSIKRFSDLADALMLSCDRLDGQLTLTFLDSMKSTPVFREYLRWFKFRDPDLFSYVLSFLSFGTKAEFEDPDFAPTAFRNWERVEDKLASYEVSPDVVGALHKIMGVILDFPAEEYFGGKFGPGSVNGTQQGIADKANTLVMSRKLDTFIRSTFYQRAYFDGSAEYINSMLLPSKASRELDTSRLMFVPKNYKTARSICMEPNAVMFFQQAVGKTLTSAISCSISGHFIHINDQTRNREGALYGSLTGFVDTVDLSSASDSVHKQLIKDLFPREWLHALFSTRTSFVDVGNDDIRKVHKFAPMGSALCFPVQSLVFLCATIYAHFVHAYGPAAYNNVADQDVALWIRRNVSLNFGETLLYESIGVYGDDIVCDSRVTCFVASILRDLGFSFNTEKSFTGSSAFRESCGIFCLFGEDVTPLRFKVKQLGTSFDPKSLESYISLCNKAGDRHFRNLHRFLVYLVVNWGSSRKSNPILFSDHREKGSAIYSSNPRNTHLRGRTSDGLMRDEFRAWTVRAKPVTVMENQRSLFEAYGYHMFWRASTPDDDTNVIVSERRVLHGAKIKWIWTPLY